MVCVYICVYVHRFYMCVCIDLRIWTPRLHVCVYISTHIIQSLHVCVCAFAYMYTDLTCVFVHFVVSVRRFYICDVYAHRVYMCVYMFAYTRTSVHLCVCCCVYGHRVYMCICECLRICPQSTCACVYISVITNRE